MLSWRALYLLVLLPQAVAHAPVPVAEVPPFRVIVGPHEWHTSLDRNFVAEAFLKKRTEWPDGTLIRPVDQRTDSSQRKAFTERVLKRSLAAVRSYWQQQIFSGRQIPPVEVDNDQAVVRYVMQHPGAIGYVSGDADLGGAHVITVK